MRTSQRCVPCGYCLRLGAHDRLPLKIDRIDPYFYAHSKRIPLEDETRIKATSEEASAWAKEHPPKQPPNFISNIFFLTIAMAHYGFLKTIDTYNSTHKQLDDIKRQLEYFQGDGSWMGTPRQGRIEAAIKMGKVSNSFHALGLREERD